ncbi:queuosine precursor transporter [Rhodocaloribacter litoris]|uniref:queuosine precursor transporter n=1 Tax=Rhodocaloribacter litoris TaxID=2558931 RepID=UPI0014240317|nr:queuosine precursor transporter [Rhodocaloribacter litoris]QXD17032.1 queuosine precursor transporter [Rhodocaloribacter litoris]GIV60041.1 MAG: membrane protein [Rhodothermaceae bacterium]
MLRTAYTLSRPQKLYVVCAAIFITALVIAEATAGKFFVAFDLPFTVSIFGQTFEQVIMTAGVLAFPITFIITDLLNEYYGKPGIRFVTYVGMVMIVFEFGLLQLAMAVPTADISPVPAEAFDTVFGATGRVIVGSITAYLLGQLADITLFHWLRRLTRGRHLWLRATGSTFGSQFIDTLVVLTIAFAGQLSVQEILAVTLFNYAYKFVIAAGITPLIYAAHWLMDRYLGHETAEALIHRAEGAQEIPSTG